MKKYAIFVGFLDDSFIHIFDSSSEEAAVRLFYFLIDSFNSCKFSFSYVKLFECENSGNCNNSVGSLNFSLRLIDCM